MTLTDYLVVEVNILGSRGGLTPVWQIHAGPYHKIIAEFTSRRDALDELAWLVNNAYAETLACGPESVTPPDQADNA